jgi:hypothetical protein
VVCRPDEHVPLEHQPIFELAVGDPRGRGHLADRGLRTERVLKQRIPNRAQHQQGDDSGDENQRDRDVLRRLLILWDRTTFASLGSHLYIPFYSLNSVLGTSRGHPED